MLNASRVFTRSSPAESSQSPHSAVFLFFYFFIEFQYRITTEFIFIFIENTTALSSTPLCARPYALRYRVRLRIRHL